MQWIPGEPGFIIHIQAKSIHTVFYAYKCVQFVAYQTLPQQSYIEQLNSLVFRRFLFIKYYRFILIIVGFLIPNNLDHEIYLLYITVTIVYEDTFEDSSKMYICQEETAISSAIAKCNLSCISTV